MKIPHHLPETRAIANANQRSGPTQEDYRIITSHQTFLFADHVRVESEESVSLLPSLNSLGLGSSSVYDLQFRDILKIGVSATADPASDVFLYIPGALSGLWEGIYRVNPAIRLKVIKAIFTLATSFSDDKCPDHERHYESACRLDRHFNSRVRGIFGIHYADAMPNYRIRLHDVQSSAIFNEK